MKKLKQWWKVQWCAHKDYEIDENLQTKADKLKELRPSAPYMSFMKCTNCGRPLIYTPLGFSSDNNLRDHLEEHWITYLAHALCIAIPFMVCDDIENKIGYSIMSLVMMWFGMLFSKAINSD